MASKCPVCGHEWRRHDPADGRCDAASEDPLRDGAVCSCGRDLAWMQARIAELSRRALGLCADCLTGDPLEEITSQITHLTRELEKARELLRELAGDIEAGLARDDRWRCVYCDRRAHYTVLHDSECPIARARHFLADTDTEGGSRAAGRTRSTAQARPPGRRR